MADFIYCNVCNAMPDQNSAHKYFMSSCGHTYCPGCRERVTADQCRVCNQKCNLSEISKLKPGMQHLFTDPLNLAKKQQREMADVLSFQKTQRARYTQFLQQQLKNVRKLHEGMAKATKKVQLLERENKELKEQVAHLKRQLLRSSGTETPCMASDPAMRYRSSGLQNSMMTVSSARTNVTAESGNSLPVGAEAANFQRRRTTVPTTPFLDESMSSPRMEFGGFDANMSRDSMNTVVVGGRNSPFSSLWQTDIQSMTLGAGESSQSSTRPINTSYMNNLTHAFRRGL